MLALTVALVAPYFIDWTSYRAAFEREAGRVLGREVTVEGEARARLLPFPSVTFTDVTVAGGQDGEPAMTVEEFSMDAELAPFLSGELLIFDMRLVRPSAKLNMDENGRIDWAVRPSSPFDPRQVTLEKVTITDGSVVVRQEAADRTVMLDDIDVMLSARTLTGPWRVEGSLQADGLPLKIYAATGTVGPDQSMRVRIVAEPEGYPIELETDGQARMEEGAARYAGTFRARTVSRRAGAEDAAEAEADNRLSGSFMLGHRRLDVEQFRFETGPLADPYTAEGQATVDLGAQPSFSITADGAQIRIGGDAENGIAGQSAEERFSALLAFLAQLPKPAMPGRVAVNLPAIVAGDTTIRDIRVEAEPVEAGWQMNSLAATLPGRTRFEGNGLLGTGENVSFHGDILLAIGQPSGFAAWLARDVDEAIRRLPSAGFSAEVALSDRRQSFENLELILGDARFRGSVERRNDGDARQSLNLALDGGRLDLADMQAFASLFVDDHGHNRLASHNVDLEIAAGPVSAEGLTAEGLDTALRLREGVLEIDRLALVGFADARISATGQISGFADDPTGNIDASIVAVDLAPLVSMLADRFPENDLAAALAARAAAFPGLFEDGEVDLFASAADNGNGTSGLAVSASGVAGGTDFSFTLSGNGRLTALADAQFTAGFTARNDDATPLYALFGLPALPWGLVGAGQAELSAEGQLSDMMQTSFRFAGDGLLATFDGSVRRAGGRYSASGAAQIRSDDLEPWLATAGISLPGFGLGLPGSLTGEVDYGSGVAVVSGLAGTIADNAVAGDLNAEIKNGLPHLTGALRLGALDLQLLGEMVVGTEAMEAGDGVWPRTPFRQSANPPFTADVELRADALSVVGASGSEASMRLRLNEEGVAVSELSAVFLGGKISGLAELKNNQGTALLSAQLQLSETEIPQLVPGSGLSGNADLSVSLTANGKSMDGLVSALAGSGSATVEGLRIAGFNPNALPGLLREADRVGPEIDMAAVEAFAPEIVRGGVFEAGQTELAFSLANGVARTPPVQLDVGPAQMSAEASADFRDRSVSASGAVVYDAGKEATAGSEPMVRFAAQGPVGEADLWLDLEPLAQYLTQRALEREQARVEHMQAVLLEKQRLRREARLYEEREAARQAAEAERVRLEREAEQFRRAEAERRQQEAEAEERAERERQEAEARRQQAEEAAEERQDAGNTRSPGIIRRPLPPPLRQQSDEPQSRRQQDTEPVLRTEGLTVRGLLDLLDQRP
ncbi:AsmA family protein [Nitratireductor luteus]|uniref:AsmA family protein n=1 Tax=Nitratireductor luteus TaxID=2976980 RepID=UPI003B846F47